jgi:hypothetical protein
MNQGVGSDCRMYSPSGIFRGPSCHSLRHLLLYLQRGLSALSKHLTRSNTLGVLFEDLANGFYLPNLLEGPLRQKEDEPFPSPRRVWLYFSSDP